MTLLAKAQSVREYLTPTLKTTAFLSRGVLTPEEFVKAGDELVYKCPTWTWEAGDPNKRKSHLPPDKQYLVTRSVPCTARVSSLENVVAQEEGDDDDGDWLVSQVLTAQEQKQREDKALEDEFDILDDEDLIDDKNNVKTAEKKLASLEIGGGVESAAQPGEQAGDESAQQQDEDDEYADMAGTYLPPVFSTPLLSIHFLRTVRVIQILRMTISWRTRLLQSPLATPRGGTRTCSRSGPTI